MSTAHAVMCWKVGVIGLRALAREEWNKERPPFVCVAHAVRRGMFVMMRARS